MGTIYQKIKGAAEAKRRSFVSLGSEDGTVSPTKINQTLVSGASGMGKKFVDHSNALMDGYNSTINEAGASFGNNLITDFKNEFKADSGGDSGKDGSVKTAAEKKKEADALAAAGGVEDVNAVLTNLGFPGGVKSPAKKTKAGGPNEKEIADALTKPGPSTTREDREGNFQNEAGEDIRVTDITTTTPGTKGVPDDYDGSGGYASKEDWAAWLETDKGKEYLQGIEGTPEKIDKSVEMKTSEEDKEEVTPGTEKTYNMGWMETRNTARAIRRKAMSDRNTTRRNKRIIKRFEKSGGTSDSERMAPEVRGAYEHFSDPDRKTKFDSPISTHTGRNRAATSETSTNTVQGKEGAITLDSKGEEIKSAGEYKSAAQTLTSGAKYKMKGSSLKR
jgi:hypothetical protein